MSWEPFTEVPLVDLSQAAPVATPEAPASSTPPAISSAPPPAAPVSPDLSAPEPSAPPAWIERTKDLSDEDWQAAISERTKGWTHDDWKKHDAWNTARTQEQNRIRLEEQRKAQANVVATQQASQAIALWDAHFDARGREGTLNQALDDPNRYDAQGNPSPQGWTQAQWRGWLNRAKQVPTNQAAREMVADDVLNRLQAHLAEDPDFADHVGDADWKKYMDAAGASATPTAKLVAFFQELAKAVTKKERASIKEAIEAARREAQAEYHAASAEPDTFRAARSNSSSYRTLEELDAAHARGQLDTPADPYGNATYRRLAVPLGRT